MRIGIVSKSDAHGGGASRIAEELTTLLNRSGHYADHLCRWSGKGFEDPHRIRLCDRFNRQIYGVQKWSKKFGYPDVIPFELPSLMALCRAKSYDLLHFHDLSSAISPLTLQYMSRRLPVVWTLHDCSGFTGGCLYPMRCERFKIGCGECPQLGQWPINTNFDRSRLWHRLRKNLHATHRVELTTPSQWMADMAVSSGMLAKAPTVIANGVDTDLFMPRDKPSLRGEIGLPTDRLIVLLSSGNIMDDRKGTKFAVDALRQIRDQNPFLLLAGNMDRQARESLADFDSHETGYISDPAQLARVYGAADLLLFCSLGDNQPLTILEAMAAGTPTIGFKTGGMPEMITQGETGFLVPQRDTKALTEALRIHANKEALARWGLAARERAVAVYSHDRFSKDYIKLYEKLVSTPDSGLGFAS